MAEEREREWLRPEFLADAPRATGEHAAALFELRPLSLGEVLDRTFALYRSRFWLFASIAAVSASVQVLVQALSLASMRMLFRNIATAGSAGILRPAPMPVRNFVASQIGTIVFLLVAAITQAATTLAVSDVYLNRPASAKQSLAVAVRRWHRWIGIALWQGGSFLWIPLLALVPGLILVGLGRRSGNPVFPVIGGVLLAGGVLAGLPAGFIFYLRNALAVPAAMVERLKIRPAMRRSKALAAGTKGRIFVVLLIAMCLYWVVGVLESPATLLIMFAPKQEHYLAQAIMLVVSFVGRTVVGPVALIGLTLVYFDQRVRKEALDLQLLLEGGRGDGARTEIGVGSGLGPVTETPGNLGTSPAHPEGFAPLG